jgi:hypothetical protein
VLAIITHYALGLLLVRAIRIRSSAAVRASEPASRPA